MALPAPVEARVTELNEKDAYRLIIFDRTGTLVVIQEAGSEHRLPTMEIPRFTRVAEELTALVRNLWHAPSVFLFSGVLGEGPDSLNFAVLELQIENPALPEGLRWFTVCHSIAHLLRGQERKTLKSSHNKIVRKTEGEDPEPFSRLGWLSKLEDWIAKVTRPLGMEILDFQQLNGCETFSLVRFSTSKGDVWFKAVGAPNLHEYGISVALARLFPSYVPQIFATKSECHGWLMSDAGGTRLGEIQDPTAWQAAVRALGDLQVSSIGRVDDVLDAGARDLSLSRLLVEVDAFLDVMGVLMEQQTKVPPPILTRKELNELGTAVKDALHCLASLHLPDTLGHGDFNPGNIIVGPERCTFIDWAEAHVGHPFLTFEYFLAHLRKDYPQLAPIESDLRASYSLIWSSVVSPEQVAEAYLFSPLVAVYAYAASSKVWRDPERLNVPGFRSYMRSLTRRMKREADFIQRRSVECLN